MKVLLYCRNYFPTIHGEVTYTHLLAKGLTELGHEVRVVTREEAPVADGQPYPVATVRNFAEFAPHLRWSDIVHFQGVPRELVLRTLVSGRRPVIAHHVIADTDLEYVSVPRRAVILASRVLPTKALLAASRRVSVSEFVRQKTDPGSAMIHNPFDQTLFVDQGMPRDRDILYAGRVDWTKGIWFLLEAVSLLKKEGITATVTVAGPLGDRIREQYPRWTEKLDITDLVQNVGPQNQAALRDLMNRHRVFVMPSIIEEAFGLSSVEAMACGCEIVSSGLGGAKEATGEFATYYEAKDSRGLAEALKPLLANREPPDPERRQRIAEHLSQFHYQEVACRYAEFYQQGPR